MTCIDLSKTVLAIYCEQVVSSLRATSSKRRTIEGIEGSPGGGGRAERSIRVFAGLTREGKRERTEGKERDCF